MGWGLCKAISSAPSLWSGIFSARLEWGMMPDEATLFAYLAVTVLAAGFWVILNYVYLRKGKFTIGSILLLMAMLGTAWGVVHFGMR